MFMFFIKHFVSQFLGYESTRGLGTNRPKVGTKRLSLGTKTSGYETTGYRGMEWTFSGITH